MSDSSLPPPPPSAPPVPDWMHDELSKEFSRYAEMTDAEREAFANRLSSFDMALGTAAEVARGLETQRGVWIHQGNPRQLFFMSPLGTDRSDPERMESA